MQCGPNGLREAKEKIEFASSTSIRPLHQDPIEVSPSWGEATTTLTGPARMRTTGGPQFGWALTLVNPSQIRFSTRNSDSQGARHHAKRVRRPACPCQLPVKLLLGRCVWLGVPQLAASGCATLQPLSTSCRPAATVPDMIFGSRSIDFFARLNPPPQFVLRQASSVASTESLAGHGSARPKPPAEVRAASGQPHR